MSVEASSERGLNASKAMEFLSANQQRLKELFEKLTPLFVALGGAADTLMPYAEAAYAGGARLWAAAQPYHPDELFEAVFGLFLCFFGGRYMITLAAIEAYKMCGWDQTLKYLKIIYEDYLAGEIGLSLACLLSFV
jgi:hypothetical protein